MAKRSFLNTSPNYIAAKKGMRGMSIGGADLHEEDVQRKQLLTTLLSLPSVENAYRRWTLGTRQEDKTYDKIPVGKFEDFEAEFNKTDNVQARKERRKGLPVFNQKDPDQHLQHVKLEGVKHKLNVANRHRDAPPSNKKPRVILIKKDKTNET
jgi:hypothetical protein